MILFLQTMAILFWDPDRIFFTLPFINHPITWYGVLFASGFFAAYFVVRSLFLTAFKREGWVDKEASHGATFLTDRLSMMTVVGTLIGARLGHVLFYDLPSYLRSPLDIFKVWEGGLASHGAAVGILLAIVYFVYSSKKHYSSVTFMATLDAVAISAGLAGGFIRLGNFVNQEILGTPTTLPWAVFFGHPAQSSPPLPLHPVQLYEAFFYFLVSLSLFLLFKRGVKRLGEGFYAGLFFISVFSFRFLIEFLKLPQSDLYDESAFISMGQLLSLPFILFGLFLIVRASRKREECKEESDGG